MVECKSAAGPPSSSAIQRVSAAGLGWHSRIPVVATTSAECSSRQHAGSRHELSDGNAERIIDAPGQGVGGREYGIGGGQGC